MAQDPQAGPIFIIGAMGSGTTLLRLVLDSHENIAIPRETGFMRAVSAQRQIPFWLAGARWWRRLGWKEQEFDEHLRQFYGEMFRRFAERQGKQRWGEKTPMHVWHVDEILRLFPDAVFLAMVRHPAGNIASLQRRFGYSVPGGIRHWTDCNSEILRQARRLPDRFALCRYEDLVSQSESTMRMVLDWLDEPWSDAVLHHHEVQSQRRGSKRLEGRNRADEPIDASRADTWQARLDERAQAQVRRGTVGLAHFFGYGGDTAIPTPDVVVPPLRAVTVGSEVAERAAVFPDVPQLWVAPEPPTRDRPYDPRVMRVRLRREQKRVSGDTMEPRRNSEDRPRRAAQQATKAPDADSMSAAFRQVGAVAGRKLRRVARRRRRNERLRRRLRKLSQRAGAAARDGDAPGPRRNTLVARVVSRLRERGFRWRRRGRSGHAGTTAR